jgi:hypothetical protein
MPRMEMPNPQPLWLVSLVLLLPAALGWSFHDETPLNGHLSFIAQLQNGVYPPRFLTFPDFELRYHYGFSLACAALTGLLRLSVPAAIDLVTMAGWFLTACLAWVLGERWLGRGRGFWAAALVAFGGGVPFFCPGPEAAPAMRLLGVCALDDVILNPPVVSYVFQHPWALGLPLALAVLLVHLERAGARPLERRVVLGLLLAAAWLSQVAVFACLAATALALECLPEGRPRLRDVTGAALTGLALAAFAWLAGGFTTPRADSSQAELTLHAGIAATAVHTLQWHLETFGLLLAGGLAGLVVLKRDRLPLLLLVAGSLLVVNLVRYAVAWDIEKFATITALGLSLLTAAALSELWERGRRVAWRALAVLGLLGSCAAGLAFPLTLAAEVDGIPEWVYPREPDPLPPEHALAVAWLREQASPGELVFCDVHLARAYAQQGGLSVPWIDGTVKYFGASRERIAARLAFLRAADPSPDAWLAQGFRWFVAGPEDQRAQELARAWQDQGRAREVQAFGEVRVIRLGD